MTKTDFIKNYAQDNNVSQAEAKNILESVFVQIERSLREDNELSFPGWGKFEVRHREAHQVRSPRTGEMMNVAAKNSVKFKAGTALNAKFNQEV